MESSAPQVATVENGIVTAQDRGTTTITVTTEEGGKTATCTMRVALGIYVAGSERKTANISTATYWKNGQAVPLTDETSDALAYSIFVD